MIDQPAGWPTEDETDFWAREAMPLHPLIVWFALTGDSTAMTIGRVPSGVGTRRGRELVVECLAPVGLDEPLSIPYQLGPSGYRAFVLATTGSDYSDEQVTLARRIQPLLVLLGRNEAVLERLRLGATVVPRSLVVADADLTGRELAVLALLAEGLTADATGRAASAPASSPAARRAPAGSCRSTTARTCGSDAPLRHLWGTSAAPLVHQPFANPGALAWLASHVDLTSPPRALTEVS